MGQDQTITFSVSPTLLGRVSEAAKFEVYASSTYGEKGKFKSSKLIIP
ncbi:MAG: hypothetical protein ABSB40_09425 [Nitrososphaeria archaeon]